LEGEHLAGIITLEDVRRIEPPTGFGLDLVKITNMLSKITVSQVMTRNPRTIASDAPLIEAARMMLEHKISTLPVVSGSHLVGIITESDIFQAFVKLESEKKVQNLPFQPIGYVENEIKDPTSAECIRSVESRLFINPELVEGLTGLQPNQTILVIFYFHRSEGFELLQYPRGDRTRTKRGVFALRSPRRPNPIGVTQVELLSMTGNILTVRGLDAIHGTPVLDLKPA
jgi:formylmethanofuran dehydrogenase subunit E